MTDKTKLLKCTIIAVLGGLLFGFDTDIFNERVLRVRKELVMHYPKFMCSINCLLVLKVVFGVIICLGSNIAFASKPTNTDKTLVSWVKLDNLTQRGGSVLTVQIGTKFDGIVFGERTPCKWMAGSEHFKRTQKKQDYGVETAERNSLIQVAIVYQGNTILIYRNVELLNSYEAENIDLLSSEDAIVVFGRRHIGGNGSICGAIEDARIYNKALTAEQLKQLRPNQVSSIKPWAWWDFESNKLEDRMGRFGHNEISKATLKNGKLFLGEKSLVVCMQKENEPAQMIPDEIPENWLTYHLAHPGDDITNVGDPNPAYYYKGLYHLHYIYYKIGSGFSFAHVSSKDMVHWKWHQTVLEPRKTGHGMYSGTGFFTKEGQPAMIYHGQGSGKNWIMFALDDNLDKWTKPRPVIPKTQTGESVTIKFWDPDCWLMNNTYYAISGGRPPRFMKSNDLNEWQYLGLLFHEDSPWDQLGVTADEDVSCPNMFKIGDKWMLLCISHDIGCRYYLGDFKDGKYLPEFHAVMNWQKKDFFAPESLLTQDGRRVFWAWCTSLDAAVKDKPNHQTGIQSLPREISLPEDGVLRIKPLEELKNLRYNQIILNNLTVKKNSVYALKDICGDALELSVTIEPTVAKEYGVNVFCDEQGRGFPIAYLPEKGVLSMGEISPPFELREKEALKLRIFIDKGMLEVFANDRQAAVYMPEHDKNNTGISIFTKDGNIQAQVKAWKMKSIYEKP